jgi:hypothetical protein
LLTSRDLLDRRLEPLLVVRQFDRQRGRSGRHDAEHVAIVNQLFRDLLEEIADAAGVPEIEMEVIDEDDEDPPRRVVGRTRRRKDDSLLRGRGRRRRDVVAAAAVRQRERDHLLLDAILQQLELVFLQIGDELPAVVTHDHVGGDQLDAGANHLVGARDCGLRRLRRRRVLRLYGGARRGQGQHHGGRPRPRRSGLCVHS